MITNTRALLPFAKTGAPPLILDHEVSLTGSTQRRLAGRLVLTPAVDLDAYHFRAVIDWIEFRMHFGRSTQVQHVQPVLRRFLDRDSYIKPEKPRPGDVFSICTIRVQEPASLALIAMIHRALSNTFGEATGARVTGIEVSIDARPKVPSDTARALILGAMGRTIWSSRDIWTNDDSRPRIAFGRGKKNSAKLSPAPEYDDTRISRSTPENHHFIATDATMYLGAKEDDVMIRVMDKVLDHQRPNGTTTALHDEQKRVRIEVTLKGQELTKVGITDIASLDRLNLSRFQGRYFQFMLPTFSKRAEPATVMNVWHNTHEEWRTLIYLRSGVTGLATMDAATELRRKALTLDVQKALQKTNLNMNQPWVGKRLAAPVLSWAEMNRKVNIALRSLMKREATARKKAGL